MEVLRKSNSKHTHRESMNEKFHLLKMFYSISNRSFMILALALMTEIKQGAVS